MAPRSWERGSAFLRKELPKARSNNWSIIAFGSREGMPADLPVDWLIDNGARGGGEDEAALNHIVNITQGWVWCAELTAALTRLGWRPTVLQGMPVPGAVAHNRQFQRTDGLPELFPWGEPIPAGQLACSYLAEIDRQIAVLDGEVFLDNRSPLRAFRGISCGTDGETFTRNARAGDLLFFFGEWTINLPWRDYLRIIRSTGADYIPSFRRGSEPAEAYLDEEIARQVGRLEPGGLIGPQL